MADEKETAAAVPHKVAQHDDAPPPSTTTADDVIPEKSAVEHGEAPPPSTTIADDVIPEKAAVEHDKAPLTSTTADDDVVPDKEAVEKDDTDLFSSAQLVASAAKSAIISRDTSSIDKEEVAGAAADLLGAAKQYGKFDDEQGIGKYVGQAESYLQQYSDSSDAADGAEKVKAEEEESAGGYGSFVKLAKGFLK